MAFRKRLTALAVLVLALGLITTASAQVAAFQCTANAGVPPLLRSEGLTELTGDIILNCTGGTPTAAGTIIPQANISVFLNTPITSRLVSSGGLSEVLLMIDEPVAADQTLCTTATCAVVGTSPGSGIALPNPFKPYTSGTVAVRPANIFQGVVAGNAVTFTGIPVEPPGSIGARVYRITNIRSNANAAGGSVSVPGGFSTPNQVVALISATPATGPTGLTSSFPINNPQQIVGFVQRSLDFSVRDPVTGNVTTAGIALPQCRDVDAKLNFFTLRYGELFATAFKTRTAAAPGTDFNVSPAPALQNVPGLIYNSESGFYATAVTSTAGNAAVGLADFGTRLRASFNNIPAGVNLFVSVFNQNRANNRAARLIGALGEGGAFFPSAATNTDFTNAIDNQVAQVTLTNGSGTAVWEVLAANPLEIQNYDFRVFYGFTSNVANNVPAIGTGVVAGSYAPISSVTTASQSAPIPRFVDTGVGSPFFRTAVCRTLLLFPFVTNQAGFDTGVAIANTTSDPFGTAAQAGSCDLYFYGANAPSVINTGSIASGTVYASVASSVAPNFQGYMFAVCSFQLGHGFAFVSDIGARNLAMGYLALVVPDPRASSALTGLPLNPGQAGELLGQ